MPGVFEIPVVIAQEIKNTDGFIALGCVIKGQTPHFEFISKSVTDAIMNLSTQYKKPIGNGILTCMNVHQAKFRSDPKGEKRKGQEAAEAAEKAAEQQTGRSAVVVRENQCCARSRR